MQIQVITDAMQAGTSALLIKAGVQAVLIDPGGYKEGALCELDRSQLPPPEVLAAVVITHAHADHISALLQVGALYPDAPILATPATADLLRVMLLHHYAHGREEMGDPVAMALLAQIVARTRAIPFREPFSLPNSQANAGGSWRMTFVPAGHVLGAAMVLLDTPEGRIGCSGDVSLTDQHTVRRAGKPPHPVDVLLLESTHANRPYQPREAAEAQLLRTVAEALGRRGHALIATAALGPAQEILVLLAKAQMQGALGATIWMDGLVRAVSAVYATRAATGYPHLATFVAKYGNPFLPDGDRVKVVEDQVEREALLAGPPAVIVTTSPSLRSGPSAFYAGLLRTDAKHAILVPSGQSGIGRWSGHGQEPSIRSTFARYELTTHADGEALAALAARWQPRLTLIVHGREGAQTGLAARLRERNLTYRMPEAGQAVMLSGNVPATDTLD